MAPETWTDERLDDLARTLRPLPEQVAKIAEAVDRLTDETKSMREDLREDVRAVREDLAGSQRLIAQIGWALVGALIAAVAALIIALV